MKHKIKIAEFEVPSCGDGCCHKTIIRINVDGGEFSGGVSIDLDPYDLDNMTDSEREKDVLTKVLSALKVDFEPIEITED